MSTDYWQPQRANKKILKVLPGLLWIPCRAWRQIIIGDLAELFGCVPGLQGLLARLKSNVMGWLGGMIYDIYGTESHKKNIMNHHEPRDEITSFQDFLDSSHWKYISRFWLDSSHCLDIIKYLQGNPVFYLLGIRFVLSKSVHKNWGLSSSMNWESRT